MSNSSHNLFFYVLFLVWCTSGRALLSQGHDNETQEKGREATQRPPVCIVGAGLSGLNIASQLQKKGERVHIFEGEGRVGGKVKTFRIIENEKAGVKVQVQVEMGAALVIRSNNRLRSLISRYNLTLFSHNLTCAGTYDESSGAIYPAPCIPSHLSETEVSKAIASYATYRAQYFNNSSGASGVGFDFGFGFVNASADLFVPIGEWLDQRGLQILKHAFIAFVVSGFGLLEDIPALYMLYTVDAKYLTDMFQLKSGVLGVFEGLDRVPEGMKNELERGGGVTISLNSAVTSISRGGGIQILRVGDQSFTCSKTVLAFPPLLSHVQPILKDLTDLERGILAEVKINKVMSSASYLVPRHLSATEVMQQRYEIKGKGEVIALLPQSLRELGNVYSSYSWIRGDFDNLPDFKDVLQMGLLRELFYRNVSTESLTFTQDATDYFPHVGFNSMRNGFFKKFNQIQGRGGLYYASTLLGFETMETALQMSDEFVQQFFK